MKRFERPNWLGPSRGFGLAAALGAASLVTTDAGASTLPVINEFSASTAGTDVEYVEIYGAPSTDYSAYKVLEIEGDAGSAGVVDEVIALGTTDANGLYLVNLPANALENGTLTLLLVQDFTGALGNDFDTDDDGAFDATPWTAIVDAVTVNDGGAGDQTYGVPTLGVSYDGQSFAPGGASRIPDGLDTDASSDWVRNDFDLAGIPGFPGTIVLGEAYNTPGAANSQYVVPPEACGDAFTRTYEIQGSGLTSPLVGSVVSTEGIVVGDFQTTGLGFYIQDDTGDGNPATSDGLSVFGGSTDVSIGDRVRVRGTVAEFSGLTQVSGVSQIWVCSSGNSVTPAALNLPVYALSDFEPYEGMLVTLPQTLYISEHFNFDRFGEVVLTTDRQYQPTAIYEPGSQAAADLAELNTVSRITLDDARSGQNPDPAIHPNGDVFDLDNLFRGGDTVTGVTGVLDYRAGFYRIQPTQAPSTYSSENPRPAQPSDVGGTFRVASLNTLNYFSTLDLGPDVCGPLANQECRGADTPTEFQRQQDKLVAALAAMDADIVGLLEMENHPQDVPTETLVNALNSVVGAGTYAYVATGAIGADAIRQALIYKPASVTPVGDSAVLDSSVDSRFIDALNRPTLAQTFQEVSTGGVFTVAVNHLKSKGSDCSAVGDPDTGDGSGNCNLTRKSAAEALVAWLASDPTGSGDEDFLIIGDLNSYDKEDPIDVLVAGGYTDLLGLFAGEGAYTYLFDGQLGYLDYALASGDLVSQVTGAVAWHVNADEPDLIDYNMDFKAPAQDLIYAPDAYRFADHDPVIVGLGLCEAEAPTLSVALTPNVLFPPNHKYVRVRATVTALDNLDPSPELTLVSVTSNEPDDAPGKADGTTRNDIVIDGTTSFRLRAERNELGTGRIYTVTYRATDDCGNATTRSATVTVPVVR